MSDMTTIETCSKCGLRYYTSLIPHECAEWTKGTQAAMTTTTNQTDARQIAAIKAERAGMVFPSGRPTGLWLYVDILLSALEANQNANLQLMGDKAAACREVTRLQEAQRTLPTQPAPDAGSGRPLRQERRWKFNSDGKTWTCNDCGANGTAAAMTAHECAENDTPDAGGEWCVAEQSIAVVNGRAIIRRRDNDEWIGEVRRDHAAQIVADHAAVPKLVDTLRLVQSLLTNQQSCEQRLCQTCDQARQTVLQAVDFALTITPRDRGGE